MKLPKLAALTALVTTLIICASPPEARAQGTVTRGTWSRTYGMGGGSADGRFMGSGTPLAVVQSVQSNSLYYITSPQEQGAASVERVLFKSDLLAGTIKWYVGTNAWLVKSNAATISGASSNIIWLSGTNSGMATNDFLIFESAVNGSLQLSILSGNATDASGLVYTNANRDCAIKIFNVLTNSPQAGDRVWKLAQVSSWTPLGLQSLTNYPTPFTNLTVVGQWFPLALAWDREPIKFAAPMGGPGLLLMNYSNAAGLHVEGSYQIIQRR